MKKIKLTQIRSNKIVKKEEEESYIYFGKLK